MKLNHKVIDQKEFYYVSSTRNFAGSPIVETDIQKVITFAYEMCFGAGHHRNCRSGGQNERKNGEKFCNTFQGKLAEVVLYNYFKSQNLHCKEPDFEIYGENIWDDCDLEIMNKKINVKSVAFQSNLLLLETKDWNELGQYIPNLLQNNGATVQYDYFVLIRIKPDIKKLFSAQHYLFCNEIPKDSIEKLIFETVWTFDIPGYCTQENFANAIANGHIIPQDSILNHYTKMDASNYYIQSGDLLQIEDLVKVLSS